jgi:uncharacterized protein YfeS
MLNVSTLDPSVSVVITAADQTRPAFESAARNIEALAQKMLAYRRDTLAHLEKLRVGWLGVTAVIGGVVAASVKLAGAVAEKELAIARLSAVLDMHSVKGRQVAQVYGDIARELRNASMQSGGDIMETMKLLTFTGGVDPTRIREATQATLNLAAATGKDLQGAAMAVSQALHGNYKAIGRLIPEMRSLGKNALGASQTLGLITKATAGAASHEMETYAAKVKQVKEAWQDIAKVGGELVLPVVKSVTSAIREAVLTFSEIFGKEPDLARLQQQLLKARQQLDTFRRSGAVDDIGMQEMLLREINDLQRKIDAKQQQQLQTLAEARKTFRRPMSIDASAKVDKAALQQATRIEALNQRLKEQTDRINMAKLEFLQREADEYHKQGANKLIVEQWLAAEIRAIHKAEREERLEAEQQLLDKIKAETLSSYEHIWATMAQNNQYIAGQSSQVFNQVLEGYRSLTEMDLGQGKMQQQYDTAQAHYEQLAKLYNQDADMQVQAEEAKNNAILLNQARTQQTQIAQHQAYANIAMGVIQTVGMFAGKNNLAMFAIQKAAAIATTIISAHAAATAAVAPPPIGLGPVAGAGLAAAMLAFGYAQAAAIAATGIAQATAGDNSSSSPPSFSGGGGHGDRPAAVRAVEEPEKPWNPTVHVHVYGHVLDSGQFIRDVIAPELKKVNEDSRHA